MAVTTSTNLAISGLASGFDWQSLVSQLVQVERAPETQLQTKQSKLQLQNNALGSIKTQLLILQNDVTTLSAPSFFDTRVATTSNSGLATAKASSGTALGTYNFTVSTLATASTLNGTTGVSGTLSSTDDVSGLVVGTAPFGTPVTAGTFTVNGKQINIASTDTLDSVFSQISTATSGAVTASYSASSDKITLTSTGEIILGSGADTSNFLQAAKLTNNGSSTITSSAKLGAVNVTSALDQSNLAMPIDDGGSGNGAFTINGVTINFSATSDSLNNVISRINDSTAGVIASYDQINNRITLADKSTGKLGISIANVTGNFATATGLAAGTLNQGTNLEYTIGDSPTLSSQTNTIGSDSSGLSGLSVSVLAQGSFSVTVGADTSTIKNAITKLVTDYNSVQGVVSTQTASSTDSTGKVTAGVLAGDSDTEQLSDSLRSLMTTTIGGLSGTLQRLDTLGFASNGQNDTLSTSDTSGLDAALSTNLSGLKDLFTHASTGLAVQLGSYLNGVVGDQGSLINHQTALTNQYNDINTQISSIETQVQEYQQRLTNEFVAMESAESQTNQQLTFLQQNFK